MDKVLPCDNRGRSDEYRSLLAEIALVIDREYPRTVNDTGAVVRRPNFYPAFPSRRQVCNLIPALLIPI